jgi:hypothetical protein
MMLWCRNKFTLKGIRCQTMLGLESYKQIQHVRQAAHESNELMAIDILILSRIWSSITVYLWTLKWMLAECFMEAVTHVL